MCLKTMRAMLGQVSTVLTAGTYTRVLPEVAHEAAALVLREARSALGRRPVGTVRSDVEGSGRGPRASRPGPTTATPGRGSAGVVPGEGW